ncbi:MAG TPA: nucleoside monophosphate kinase [Candidatus Babeliales bacterium]|jgi:adenylate kinase|nr:nucleoside monophosphate kinase [Candidatus Babeliales bacterium]
MQPQELYILLGPPGSGKGTLANRCTEFFGWLQLSTGDLCRQHIQESTQIGRQIDFAIKSGKLISDQVITQMVLDWFMNKKSYQSFPVVLDGFPRTMVQADLFHTAFCKAVSKCSILVIELDIDDAIVVKRLANRYVCDNKDCQAVYTLCNTKKDKELCAKCYGLLIRRNDDVESTVKERLKVYRAHRDELIRFYTDFGIKVTYLDARVSPEILFAQFQNVIKNRSA